MSRIADILEYPTLYRVWQAPFAAMKFAPVAAAGVLSRANRVLDIGCGPGTNARWFKAHDYLGVDLNQRYIDSARRRYGDHFMTRDVKQGLGDLGRFDLVLMNSLMHHLDDEESKSLLRGVAEVVAEDGSVHILDLVLPEDRSIARALARADRGAYPRSQGAWVDLVSSSLSVQSHEEFSLRIGRLTLWRMVHVVGVPFG